MSKKHSMLSRVLAVFLAVLIVANVPVSAFASETSQQSSSIPNSMLYNVALDSIEYLGYKISWLRDNGHLYEFGWYGWSAVDKTTDTGESILTGIPYAGIGGMWTDKNTGLPNVSHWKQFGIDCTGFVAYYYFNYLPNVAGVNTSHLKPYFSSGDTVGRTVDFWSSGAKRAVAAGLAEKVGSSLADLPKARIGDLLIFRNTSSGNLQHAAVYVGEVNGEHFMIHQAGSRGPELYRISDFEGDDGVGNKASPLYEIYHLDKVNPTGTIKLSKKDPNGINLSGAKFIAINTEDPTFSFEIGPTDANGYAELNDIPYGTYLVTETVFPVNYGPSTQTSWTVTIGSTAKTVTINAENKLKTGYISAQKGDEFGNPLSNVSFGIYSDANCTNLLQTMTTGSNGVATSTALDCGKTYYVKETAAQSADYVINTDVYSVTVAADSTVWVNNGNAITNYLKKGAVGIKKADEFGNPLSGVKFGVYSNPECTTLLGEVTTNSSGEAVYGKNGNNYSLRCRQTVYFKEISASSSDYVLDTTVYPVAVNAETTTYANNGNAVVNYLKNGAVGIKKTDSNSNPLSGVVYGVYSNQSCSALLGTMTTDTNGVAVYGKSGNNYSLRCRQTVYVKELQPKDDTYLIDTTVYPVTVSTETVSYANGGVAVINPQKYWQLTVKKTDSENGGLTAGDANIVGAVYGLYDSSNALLKKYTVGADGSFTTDKYLAGTGYYLKEIEAPEGYKLDPAAHYLNDYTDPAKLNKELTTATHTLKEIVKTGTVNITKFTADPKNPGVYNVPEKGAEFYIYLKSAGSYDRAVATGDPRLYDYGTVDEDGNVIWSNTKATSKDLAYGTYIVHQVSSWENRILVEDFEVVIENDNQNFNFSLNNPYYEGTVVINKRDSESGKLITVGEATFRIRDTATGELLAWYDAENDATITEFKTVNGTLTLPMKVPYGSYRIEEVSAPKGYMPSGRPVEFVIDKDHNGTFVFDIENDPLKGIIEVEKTGLQFTSVNEKESNFGTVYQPVFTEKLIAGVTFKIVANEDIVTGDGTIHYKKGDVVDTIVTSGTAPDKSKELYIGNYLLIEEGVPAGYILDSEPKAVEVANDGKQLVSMTSVSVKNDRASTEVTLEKEAEVWVSVKDDTTGFVQQKIGVAPGIGFAFGLYANEDFTAVDGTEIKKDSLVGVVVTDENGKAAFTENVPFGKYYVAELAVAKDYVYALDETKHDVDLSIEAGETEVSVALNNGDAILNKIVRYPVTINKSDLTTGQPVPGALVAIMAKNGDVLYEGYTSEEGELTVWLQPGEYTFKEVEAPDGYVPTKEEFVFKVNMDGTMEGKVEFENELTEVVIQKTEKDTEILLDEAKLVIKDKDGNVVHIGETVDGKLVVTGLLIGMEYAVEEEKAPDGYAITKQVYGFVIREDGSVEDDITIENEKTLFEVLKTDENGNPLSGAEFTMYDADGKEVDKQITGADGKCWFSGFGEGKYTIVETKAPAGYELSTVKIEIENDGTWENGTPECQAVVENVKTPEPPAEDGPPKTGDRTAIGFFVATMLVALVGMIICGTTRLIPKRKRKS